MHTKHLPRTGCAGCAFGALAQLNPRGVQPSVCWAAAAAPAASSCHYDGETEAGGKVGVD